MFIAWRSNPCDSGSTDNAESFPPNAKWFDESIKFETMFAFVNITPFGSPVVPDV